jgi:hypothetical protein
MKASADSAMATTSTGIVKTRGALNLIGILEMIARTISDDPGAYILAKNLKPGLSPQSGIFEGHGQISTTFPVNMACGLGVLESMKSQTPSTKLQTNLKFQYSMTKTQNRFVISNFGH